MLSAIRFQSGCSGFSIENTASPEELTGILPYKLPAKPYLQNRVGNDYLMVFDIYQFLLDERTPHGADICG